MRFLPLLLLFAYSLSAGQSPTPTLTNFNQKQFIISPIGPGTIATNVIRLRLDPSQFDTNANQIRLTNSIGASTNVFNVLIVTNVTVINNITVGGTNVAVVNPTIGFIPFKSGSNSFGDSPLFRVDATTVYGSELDLLDLVVTNLMGGGIVLSEAGTGRLTNGAVADFLLWTNVGGILQPLAGNNVLVTNLSSVNLLSAPGAFLLGIGTNITLDVGAPATNDVNPYGMSYIQFSPPTPGSSSNVVRLSTGNGPSEFLFLENTIQGNGFTVFNGDELTDNAFAHLFLRGDWAPTNKGESLFLTASPYGWVERQRGPGTNGIVTGGTELWTLDTTLHPSDQTQQPEVDNGWEVGPNTLAFWGAATAGESLVGVRVVSSGDPNANSIFIAASQTMTQNDASGVFDLNMTTNRVQYNLGVTSNSVPWAISQDVNPAASDGFSALVQEFITENSTVGAFRPAVDDTNNTPAWMLGTLHTLHTNAVVQVQNNGTNRIALGPLAQITFGPGDTNVLYRSGNDLVITNTAGTGAAGLLIATGDGIMSRYSSGGNLAQIAGNSGVDLQDSLLGGNELRWAGNALQPLSANATVGSMDTGVRQPFGKIENKTNQVWGFFDTTTTNYAYLEISHTGTNGVVLLSSQAGGTAGAARPFEMNRNLGASLTVGDTTYVDVFKASQTNQVSGAITISYATNGLDQVDFTHVRWFFNASGSDQTLSIPAGWKTNIFSPVPSKITNGVTTKMYLHCIGATDTAAKQTNCFVSFEFYQ